MLAKNLEVFHEIALEAGKGIQRFRKDILNVEAKDDSSPVTQADLWAHDFIENRLKQLTPDIPVISEEVAFGGVPSLFWLVDPLDGTKEYINGFDDYTVNIALICDGRAIFGIVGLPEKNLLYSGGQDFGSMVFEQGVGHSLSTRAVESTPRVAVSRSHLDDLTLDFCSKLPRHEKVQAGSSLKFCLIAGGDADLYPRFGKTMEWDTAAGQAVLEGAGGQVLRVIDLEPLGYGKDGLENPSFVALGHSEWKNLLVDLDLMN